MTQFKILLSLIMFILVVSTASFAGTSASFIVSTEVFGGGGGDIASASHAIHGKSLDMGYGTRSSISYRMGDGFIHACFEGLVFAPIITSISPSTGYNNSSIAFNIYGANFLPSASVSLVRPGATEIIGESIVVVDSGTINCTFNLTGSPVGYWNVQITNTDTRVGTLENALNVIAPTEKVDVISKPINYPNPFDPDVGPTKIKFELSSDAPITVSIFNISGTRIWQETYPAGGVGGKSGINEILWDGYTRFSEQVPNGMYVYAISSGGKTLATGKIAVFR